MSVDAVPEERVLDRDDLPEVMSNLLEDHRHLTRILDALASHLEPADLCDPEALDLLANLVDYVAEYPERVHHPREDRINERLVDTGLTPGERVLVELTVAQHAELAAFTARLESDIDAVLSHGAEANSRFLADMQGYFAMQKEHMRREEQQLFPMALRLLSADDWNEIVQSERGIDNPTHEALMARYRSLYDLADSADGSVTRR